MANTLEHKNTLKKINVHVQVHVMCYAEDKKIKWGCKYSLLLSVCSSCEFISAHQFYFHLVLDELRSGARFDFGDGGASWAGQVSGSKRKNWVF